MMYIFILAYHLKSATQLVCKTLPQICSVFTNSKYHGNKEQEAKERVLSLDST